MANFITISLILIFAQYSLCFIELPLIRKQQLQVNLIKFCLWGLIFKGTVGISDLSSSQFVSNNDSTATGICFLTLDLKNCSTQDNLGTIIGLGSPREFLN